MINELKLSNLNVNVNQPPSTEHLQDNSYEQEQEMVILHWWWWWSIQLSTSSPPHPPTHLVPWFIYFLWLSLNYIGQPVNESQLTLSDWVGGWLYLLSCLYNQRSFRINISFIIRVAWPSVGGGRKRQTKETINIFLMILSEIQFNYNAFLFIYRQANIASWMDP